MWRAALSGLSLAAILAGCGGTDTDTGSDYAHPDQASFCQALGEAECNTSVVKACYGSDDATLPADRESCITARAADCNPAELPYHPERADACLAARSQALADGVWTHQEIDAVDEACLPVFSKEGPEGAICAGGTDCDTASGLVCIIKLGDLEGICAIPVAMSGGEDCASPEAVCGDGFYCDPQVSHCLANPEVDDACSAAAPCDSTSYCTSPDDGSCVEKTKNGDSCTKDELCSGGFCVGATDSKPGVCSSTWPLQINAESCDPYRM